MALNVDVLRRLILALQDKAGADGAELLLPVVPAAEVPEYRRALVEARLADVFDDSHFAEKAPHRVFGLTATGQVFSERIRDEPAWNEAKETLRQAGQPVMLASLLRLLM